MTNDSLRSVRFRAEREHSWVELERLLSRLEKKSEKSLTDEEMIAMPSLYRATLSSLSVARATSLDQALIEYLEALSTRAYFFIYGVRSPLRQRILQFFTQDWPKAVSSLWREVLASALFMTAGVIASFVLTMVEPEWYFAFVPPDLAAGRDPNASAEFLRSTLYASASAQKFLSVLAAFLFTHNAQIALMAFALGFAFCLPSALLVAYNGCMLGAMFAVYAAHGLAWQFGGWVFIHGVTELFAIAIAGAAGLRIGWAIAFPGARSRLAAAESAGRQAGAAVVGVIVMLFIAGLLEGFARQLVTSDLARWIVAIGSGAFWCGYFFVYSGRKASS